MSYSVSVVAPEGWIMDAGSTMASDSTAHSIDRRGVEIQWSLYTTCHVARPARPARNGKPSVHTFPRKFTRNFFGNYHGAQRAACYRKMWRPAHGVLRLSKRPHPAAPMQPAYLEFTFHPPHRTALTILVAVLCVLPVHRWLPRRATMALRAVRKRRRAAIVLVGFISFFATSLLASKRGLPLPYVHDEFSYLLAADTFARARLANPPPAPTWEHFETMHVLVKPRYQSKYPPGQGFVLAFGQVVLGHPIRGVWVVTATACMAITWMLLALVPPRWALIGGLITALHPQVLEWGQ